MAKKNAMEQQLDLVNKAIDYAISIEEMYNVENFDLKTERGKAKYTLAKRQALKKWVSYDGDNPYILAIRRKYTGKISSGGMGGVSIDFGQDDIPQGLHIGSLKDWTWGRNTFNTNKAGTHISSGHVRGMPTSKGALTELKQNQAWILKALSVPQLTGKDLKNVPWAVLHSDNPELEKYFGRWDFKTNLPGDKAIPNPLQIGGRSFLRNKEGPDNPFTSERWVDAYYDAKDGTTITQKGKHFGIFPYSKTTTGPLTLNHPNYGFKTDHFGDSTFSGSEEKRDKGSTIKSLAGHSKFGDQVWTGRDSGRTYSQANADTRALLIKETNNKKAVNLLSNDQLSRFRISGAFDSDKSINLIGDGRNTRIKKLSINQNY